MFSYFGSILYIGLLFTNAIAILNEERFLAKSESYPPYCSKQCATNLTLSSFFIVNSYSLLSNHMPFPRACFTSNPNPNPNPSSVV